MPEFWERCYSKRQQNRGVLTDYYLHDSTHIDGKKSYNFVVLHKLEEGGGNNQKNTLSKLFLQPFFQLLLGEKKRYLKGKKGHFRKKSSTTVLFIWPCKYHVKTKTKEIRLTLDRIFTLFILNVKVPSWVKHKPVTPLYSVENASTGRFRAAFLLTIKGVHTLNLHTYIKFLSPRKQFSGRVPTEFSGPNHSIPSACFWPGWKLANGMQCKTWKKLQ